MAEGGQAVAHRSMHAKQPAPADLPRRPQGTLLPHCLATSQSPLQHPAAHMSMWVLRTRSSTRTVPSRLMNPFELLRSSAGRAGRRHYCQ